MSFWENKTVLVTGVNGFVGNHLFNKLNNLGARVYGVTRNHPKKNIYKLDVLDLSSLESFIKKNKIKICFHLAGESLVEKGQEDPYNTFKANTEGTLNVLESARKNNLEKIVIASSSHVYGDNKTPYLEEYFPRPSRPYETSKTCADLIAQSYADSFDLPVLIPRFVNIYGPGDINFQRLIPKTMKSLLNNDSPKMWGGSAVRDFIYIADVIEAYISLGELNKKLMEKNRIYNFGTGNTISVEELIRKIISISEQDFSIKKNKEERENEIDIQYVSSAKAHRILNWKSKTNLDKGLSQTLEWYRNYFNEKI